MLRRFRKKRIYPKPTYTYNVENAKKDVCGYLDVAIGEAQIMADKKLPIRTKIVIQTHLEYPSGLVLGSSHEIYI